MYSGSFYSFPSAEERWAYMSRMIWVNLYQSPPKPVYEELYNLVKDKDYFVLTTNVDHCFQKAGFAPLLHAGGFRAFPVQSAMQAGNFRQ